VSNDVDCAATREQLGAYVLDALDRVETRAVEQHLWTCEACRAELSALEDAAGEIALSVPLTRAPTGVRSRVMSAIAAPAPLAQPSATQPEPATSKWRWAAIAAGAAAALLVAALLGWAVALQTQVNDLEDEQQQIAAQHADAQQQLAGLAGVSSDIEANEATLLLLSDEDARYASLDGQGAAAEAEGLYVWSPGEHLGVLLSKDLADAPDGMTYHLWLRTEGGTIDGGTFTPDEDGTAAVVVGGSNATPVSGGGGGPLEAVVVTLEASSGEGEEPAVVMSGEPTETP
jgi:hypothetical protein